MTAVVFALGVALGMAGVLLWALVLVMTNKRQGGER